MGRLRPSLLSNEEHNQGQNGEDEEEARESMPSDRDCTFAYFLLPSVVVYI